MNNSTAFLLKLFFLNLGSLILVPYAQASANSHYYEGRFLGAFYYIVAIIVILRFLWKHKGWKTTRIELIRLALLLCTWMGWGYCFRAIMCTACANAG
ncbi:MAG: hypothetical protein AB8E82_00525 [Aureispira sp.]